MTATFVHLALCCALAAMPAFGVLCDSWCGRALHPFSASAEATPECHDTETDDCRHGSESSQTLLGASKAFEVGGRESAVPASATLDLSSDRESVLVGVPTALAGGELPTRFLTPLRL